tara:strand:+ start:863 stop:1021 length:159 start_codon:yes stop_codon:yes gene_type:complete
MGLIQSASTVIAVAVFGRILMSQPIPLMVLGTVGAGVSGYIVGGIIEGVVND